MKTTRFLPALAAALVFPAAPINAGPGDMDATFGGTGKVTTAIGGTGSDIIRSMAMQGDGRIVAAGYSYNGGNVDFALARYNADGSLDTTLGGTGKVTTSFGSGGAVGRSVAVQGDGKLVVAGNSYNAGNVDFALARYNADGSLDTSFGAAGKVITDFAGSNDHAQSMALQSDGKIVVAGFCASGTIYRIAVARYDHDGSLDATFGSSGKLTTMIGSSSLGASVVIQSDGKILVAGSSTLGLTLVRYLGDGALDSELGGTGIVTTAGIGGGEGVAVQSDGKILVAGTAADGNDGAFALVRYLANGSLDTTFNGTGKVSTDIDKSDRSQGVSVQSDGKIIVGGMTDNGPGSSEDPSYNAFAMVRYLADGSLDSCFGSGGKVKMYGSIDHMCYCMAMQSDGKILLAGNAWTGSSYDFAVVRYQGGPFPPFDQWKMTHLSNVNAPDLGDGDRDGLSLLAEYAFSLSPTASSLPPPVERHLYAEGERLRIFFTRDTVRNDVTLEVQAAASPAGPWTTVAASTLGGVTTGPGYVGGDDASPGLKTVEVRDTVDISATTSRYLRVKVTR